MRIAIFAEVSSVQLDYLRRLAAENGIDANIVVEGESQPQPATRTVTPITGEMLTAVAAATGRSVVQVAVEASNLGVTTVEEALVHESVPSEVKRILEGYL